MVSILYHRQEQERERRLERLSSARKAGALLSIISARSYCEQKKEQEKLILREEKKQWKAAQEIKLKEIAEAINNAERNRMTAHIMAEAYRCTLHNMATLEKGAWKREKNLESARYALAVKTMEHDNNRRNASKRESQMYRAKSALMEQTRLQKLKAVRYYHHHQPSTIENVKSEFKQRSKEASTQNDLTRVQFDKSDKLLRPFNNEYKERVNVYYYGARENNKNLMLHEKSNEVQKDHVNEIYESSAQANNNNNSNNDNDDDDDDDDDDDGVHTIMHITPCSCKRRPVIDANKINSLHGDNKDNKGNSLSNANNNEFEKTSSNVKLHEPETEKSLFNTLCHETKLQEWHLITNGERAKRENLQKRKAGLFDHSSVSVESESEQHHKEESDTERKTESQEEKPRSRVFNTQKTLGVRRNEKSNQQSEVNVYKNDEYHVASDYEYNEEINFQPLAREHIKLHNTGTELYTSQKHVTADYRDKEIERPNIDFWQKKIVDQVDLEREALSRERAAVKAFREEFLLTHLTSSAIKRQSHKICKNETDDSTNLELNNIIYLPIQTILSPAQISDNLKSSTEQVNETETSSFTVQQLDFNYEDVEEEDEKQGSDLHDYNYVCGACDNEANCKSKCPQDDAVDKNNLCALSKSSTDLPNHLTCERNVESNMTDKRVEHDRYANNKHLTNIENKEKIEAPICDDNSINIMTNDSEHNTTDVINDNSTNVLHKEHKQTSLNNDHEDPKREDLVIVPNVLTEKCVLCVTEPAATNDKELSNARKLDTPTTAYNHLYEKEMIDADTNNQKSSASLTKLAPTLFSLLSSSSTATEHSVISKSSSSSSSSPEAITTPSTSFSSSPATTYSEKMSNTSSPTSSSSSHCSSSSAESSTLLSTSTNSSLLTSTSSDCQTMTAEQLRNALTQLRQKLMYNTTLR